MCVCVEEGGTMPNTSPELAPTKLARFFFLPLCSGAPRASSSSGMEQVIPARCPAGSAGFRNRGAAGANWRGWCPVGQLGKPWACDLAGGLPGASPPSNAAAPP